MNIASLGRRIEHLIHTDPSVLASMVFDSGFSCQRCGWCCRENFSIRITRDILRPSNAVSVFPDDVRHIIKNTGMQWDEIAEPDIYSCLSDGNIIWVIGWILRRSREDDCIFYRNHECSAYEYRPLICRCYPFFMGENGVEVMYCNGMGNKMTPETAAEIGKLLKKYELKKLRNYISIIRQMGDVLRLSSLRSIPGDYPGEIILCDGEAVSVRRL